MSERFQWQIDVGVLFVWLLAGALLILPGCCSVRPMGVGFLGEIGAISPTTEEQWIQRIELECASGPESAEPSAPSRSWWERFWDE